MEFDEGGRERPGSEKETTSCRRDFSGRLGHKPDQACQEIREVQAGQIIKLGHA